MPFPTLPTRLIGINTKMYFDYPTTTAYINTLSQLAPQPSSSTGIFIIPSYPMLESTCTILSSTPHVLLGAQNCHTQDAGPHTGEVSPLMLKQIGCKIVLLGHAERRSAAFQETDEVVAKKAEAVVRNGMIPLVCIGEYKKSNIISEGVGIAIRKCRSQIMIVLRAIPSDAPVIFAYEPVWAIGAEEPAGADHVVAVANGLRGLMREWNRELMILYGGSAGPGTWEKLKEGVDGLFLGRFAHNVENLGRVIREVEGE